MLKRLRKKTNKDDIIKQVYYDIVDGYGSAKVTFDKAKEIDNNIKLDDVKTYLSKQPNKQLNNYRNYNSYVAPFARFEYQIDIMDMVALQKEPNQPRYALVVIDIFQKRRRVTNAK
jgi:hypothetical protein